MYNAVKEAIIIEIRPITTTSKFFKLKIFKFIATLIQSEVINLLCFRLSRRVAAVVGF